MRKTKDTSRHTQRILLVDDEPKFLNGMARRLRLSGFDPLTAAGGREAVDLALNHRVGLAIVDLKMPDMDGLVTIAKLREIEPNLRTVLLTGHGDEKVRQASEAMDSAYFEKDEMGDFWKFIRQVQREGNVIVIRPPSDDTPAGAADGFQSFSSGKIEIHPKTENITGPRRDLQFGNPAPATAWDRRSRMIGETLMMQQLRLNIKRFAALDCPVIITGETGVGKEAAARAIHEASPRSGQHFTAINCGCFSNDLFVEELFEAVPLKTGIQKTRPRGTILLDQIEDLSPQMQLSMLKVIDRNKNHRRGDPDEPLYDVRIIAASHADLGRCVETGAFSKDLYFRLNVVELFIPPLRERREDIAPLCSFFLARFAREFGKNVSEISEEVMHLLSAYDFPGNVRELEHVIERAVIIADGKQIALRHLPERFQTVSTEAPEAFKTLAQMEKEYILRTLKASGGNKSKTAEILGISRAALWRKLKQFGTDS